MLLSLPASSNTAINTTTTHPPPSPLQPSATPASTLPLAAQGETTQTELLRPPVIPPPPPPTNAISSVAWAPSCGRSYHLIATGGRDGHVRIWKVKPGNDGFYGGSGGGGSGENGGEDDVNSGEDDDDPKWIASVVADFDQHRSAVGRVEWNITGYFSLSLSLNLVFFS